MSEHSVNNMNGNRLTYLLIGAGVGAAVALLLAPKSGKELRKRIADVSRRGVQKGSDTIHAIGGQVAEHVEGVREAVESKKTALAGAIEAGKSAYRQERGRGDA